MFYVCGCTVVEPVKLIVHLKFSEVHEQILQVG